MAKRGKNTLDYLGVLAGETAASLSAVPAPTLVDIPLENITRSPFQSRQHFDQGELMKLADTIRAHGVLQPIVVRPQSAGYELIAGERRWRAAQLVGLTTIPAVIREVSDDQAATLLLVENLQRTDLNPIEEAEGYQTLIDRGLSQQAVGVAVGKSVSAISRTLGLLKLAGEVKELIRKGQLDYSHGRVLLSLHRADQLRLAQQAIRREWSSRQLEEAARRVKEQADSGNRRGRQLVREDPNIVHLRDRIALHLRTRVEFRSNKTGTGSFIIHYSNAEECNRILEELKLIDLE